jgi:hypothetical protein
LISSNGHVSPTGICIRQVAAPEAPGTCRMNQRRIILIKTCLQSEIL